ncbi:MAG: hypothetical protein KC619_33845 [Myxococcales bacterium]|nr:hypothetical protein [Myxococcales bacterium]
MRSIRTAAALGLLPAALLASVAAACWCRELTIEGACTRDEGRYFFTGEVVSVTETDTTHHVRVRVERDERHTLGSHALLAMGDHGPGAMVDCTLPPPRVGAFVLMVTDHVVGAPTTSGPATCPYFRILPTAAAARRDPCAP